MGAVAQEPTNPLGALFSRLGLPTDQIDKLQHQVGKALMPAEQLRMMRDLITTFAPSADQLEAIRRQLEAQRAQLESMNTHLDEIEQTLDRLANSADQVNAMQEPFLRLARTLFGGDGDQEEEEL